jgi:hypothetical protein
VQDVSKSIFGVAEFRYEKLEERDGRWEMGDGRWELGE